MEVTPTRKSEVKELKGSGPECRRARCSNPCCPRGALPFPGKSLGEYTEDSAGQQVGLVDGIVMMRDVSFHSACLPCLWGWTAQNALSRMTPGQEWLRSVSVGKRVLRCSQLGLSGPLLEAMIAVFECRGAEPVRPRGTASCLQSWRFPGSTKELGCCKTAIQNESYRCGHCCMSPTVVVPAV